MNKHLFTIFFAVTIVDNLSVVYDSLFVVD